MTYWVAIQTPAGKFHTVWMPSKEQALGLVRAYNQLGIMDVDWYEDEETVGIPF